jgi:hypothetical protein
MAHNLQVVPSDDQAALAHDGHLHLARNLIIHPDKLIGDGNGILGTGMPGSGKTTLLARLLEQFGACGLPFAVFDLEGDLLSLTPFLPRGVRATAQSCPTVKEMYQDGLQVIFDLSTWGKESSHACHLMTATVSGLLDYTKALPPNVRVPFLVGLDEAAYWLPQNSRGCSYLEASLFKELFSVFHNLTLRGRKMGLVPLLFTQRFASVHKDVLSTTGTFILMKQTMDTDLKRYMEYINADAFGKEDLIEKEIRARIAAFKPGQVVIKLPSGKQGVVQFYNRESEHSSHAPKTASAINTYRAVNFDPSRSYGAFRAESEVPETPKLAVHPAAYGGHDSPFEASIRALLAENPEATAREVAAYAHCGKTAAQKWMARIQNEQTTGSDVEARMRALLWENPRATVTEVAEQARIQQNTQTTGSVVEARMRALLSENPNASVNAVAEQAHCSYNTARKWIAFIQASHEQLSAASAAGKKESETLRSEIV